MRFLILFLLSFEAYSQIFVKDITDIRDRMSRDAINLHLSRPTKEGLPGIYFAPFMPSYSMGSLNICPTYPLPSLSLGYQVLIIGEDRPSALFPNIPPAVHVVAVKYKYPKGADSGELPIVHFKQENMDEVIHFANPVIEFRYSSGMKVNKIRMPGDDANPGPSVIDSSNVNWLKDYRLNLHLAPAFHINTSLTMSETLSTKGPKKIAEWEKIRFQTNQVNLNVETETRISSRITVRAGGSYEENQAGSTAGFLGSLDIKVPDGGEIVIFTSYRAPLSLTAGSQIPLLNQGGGGGVKYKDKSGVQVKAGVNGVGSPYPSMDAGISIPFDISPKK